jgi:hypothetical protein
LRCLMSWPMYSARKARGSSAIGQVCSAHSRRKAPTPPREARGVGHTGAMEDQLRGEVFKQLRQAVIGEILGRLLLPAGHGGCALARSSQHTHTLTHTHTYTLTH